MTPERLADLLGACYADALARLTRQQVYEPVQVLLEAMERDLPTLAPDKQAEAQAVIDGLRQEQARLAVLLDVWQRADWQIVADVADGREDALR